MAATKQIQGQREGEENPKSDFPKSDRLLTSTPTIFSQDLRETVEIDRATTNWYKRNSFSGASLAAPSIIGEHSA
jgi:hypothetical protein